MEEDKGMQYRWISSVDIINKTGISRATLNNYIKMGILPQPIVRKPAEATVRARMIGYFPDTALDRLEQIKVMKKDGFSMKIIINKLKSSEPVQLSGEVIKQEETRPAATDSENASPQPEPSLSPQGAGNLLSSRTSGIQDLFRKRMPTLVSFCVLVAELQDSIRICAELPPEEYFELIGQIWTCVEGSFKKYCGAYGTYGRDGMHYYFLKERDNQYMMNAISCALEIRENIKKLNMKWKIRRGWFNELYLNIGINEGQEYFGTIPSSPSVEFTALGDSVNYAGRLSDFARYGAIWTTKNLINKLTLEEKDGIRYGIRRMDQDREILVENSFSRIIDMIPQDNIKTSKFMDIATIAVTEILGKR